MSKITKYFKVTMEEADWKYFKINNKVIDVEEINFNVAGLKGIYVSSKNEYRDKIRELKIKICSLLDDSESEGC